jgi:hypothetical protein
MPKPTIIPCPSGKVQYEKKVEALLCECGCGGTVPIARYTCKRSGWTKDHPKRFVRGHNRKGKTFPNDESKPYWQEIWLFNEYVIKGQSASDIAHNFGCHTNNVLYFLNKHNIPRRTSSEQRTVKKWGLVGKNNPMFGKNGSLNPNWKGGISTERKKFNASKEWKMVVQKIWKRDKAICQRCKLKAFKNLPREFHIHHIISFTVKELRLNLDNLILLCRSCHEFVHSKSNIIGEFIGG